MLIRQADKPDVTAIAELALIAGEAIPGWFCARSTEPEQEFTDAAAAGLIMNRHI